MTEFVALFAVGGAIAAGVGFGTHYIHTQLRVDDSTMSADAPIVRPIQSRHGKDWHQLQKS